MIKIEILCSKGEILDRLKTKDTTLSENALVIRRLEEVKQRLLDMDYENDLEVKDEE